MYVILLQIYMVSQSAIGASQELHRRVSGYYTSSQSSLARTSLAINPIHPNPCHQKLRKQSDLQLIRCVQDNAKSRFSYFVKPPLSFFTLFFKSREMEKEYRNNAHRIDEKEMECPTLATSRFNTYLDVLVSAVIFLLISASLFVLYEPRPPWIAVFAVFVIFQLVAIALCIHRHWDLSKSLMQNHEHNSRPSKLDDILYRLSHWYPWHLFGGIFLSIPVLSVLANFSCSTSPFQVAGEDQSYYIYLFCVSLLHFCNFTQINWLVKNALVLLSAVIFILISLFICNKANSPFSQLAHAKQISFQNNLLQAISILQDTLNASLPEDYNTANSSFMIKGENVTGGAILPALTALFGNAIYSVKNLTNIAQNHFEEIHHQVYVGEICLDIVLILILVWFLNREFEISYRMSFYGNIVANRDNIRIQSMRNQADWLLHNIIPRHVADQLKNTAKYSENHKNVGIIFASIVNFNEMYDESYLGGKEYLRVLNELIGDFDELLEHPEFRSVDKIKTIGSTFMAASGLNPQMRQENPDPHAHLYALMDFALAMQRVVYEFNRDLLEFNLILRVGYNFGDVTAGVIGTTKLYYDIWGDAVNIASRMDSTGVNGRIQVGEACTQVLGNVYDLEPRGSVYVKGKDNMNVFLLLRKKPVDVP